MQDRYKSCVGITNLLNLSCNGHETFDQMSVCVRDWGCDTCMLLSGHFCSFIMGCWYTPCKVMVLLRLHTHVVAWTERVSCNALWQHALCYDYWLQGIQPTALEVKCYASLAEGHLDSHQRVWMSLSTIIVKQSLVYLFYYLCTSWNYSNREQTLVYTISTRTDPGYRYIVQQTLVHTMCCSRNTR